LELTRLYSPEATFIFTSTNKVYGDTPNILNLIEQDSRFDLPHAHKFWPGIDESMSIDYSTHSLFGVSKCSADLLVQEYGRYFDLRTGVFRGGCLTGPMHSGARLHGFLSYLVKSIVLGNRYNIFGYKGKQVRDNLHAKDLILMFMEFHKNPKSGEVYNVGGGRDNSISILEAIKLIELNSGSRAITEYQEVNRTGDHKWYITNLAKFRSHYPNWKSNYPLDKIITDMVKSVRS
jgi:CDP-paratose 2-epimerase